MKAWEDLTKEEAAAREALVASLLTPTPMYCCDERAGAWHSACDKWKWMGDSAPGPDDAPPKGTPSEILGNWLPADA